MTPTLFLKNGIITWSGVTITACSTLDNWLSVLEQQIIGVTLEQTNVPSREVVPSKTGTEIWRNRLLWQCYDHKLRLNKERNIQFIEPVTENFALGVSKKSNLDIQVISFGQFGTNYTCSLPQQSGKLKHSFGQYIWINSLLLWPRKY